jgi:hypothetical protein
MNALIRKIRELEKNVINDTPDSEDTYIGTSKKEEQELFRVAHKILEEQIQRLTVLEEKQKTNPTFDYTVEKEAICELTGEAEVIVSQATRIAVLRASHIFDTTIASFYHLNDPASKIIFYTRFFWFLSEMKDWLHHMRMEHKIMGEPGFFNLCKGEQDKKLKPCYDSWRRWLLDESFSQWLKNNPITPPNSKTTKEANVEEEDMALMEKEFKAEEEKNVQYLKETCPTCPHQMQ